VYDRFLFEHLLSMGFVCFHKATLLVKTVIYQEALAQTDT